MNINITPQTLREITYKLGLNDPAMVEKDLYVTQVLHALSDLKNENFQLVFIGGTCLSKAHRVVERMSEDIDFKLVPLSNKTLNSKIARKEMSDFRKEVLKQIEDKTGLAPKEDQIRKGNNNKFTQIFLDYPALYPTNATLRQQIKIELTVQGATTPIQYLPINSLVYDVLGKASGMDVKTIACISLEETATEKWAALNRRVADVERSGINPDNAIIRHLFDLHAIHKKHGISSVFETLVCNVVLRDRERFKGKSPYFFEYTLQEIAFGSKILVENPAWEERYKEFLNNMVFQKETPPYQEALETLTHLNERAFNAMHSNELFQKALNADFSEVTNPQNVQSISDANLAASAEKQQSLLEGRSSIIQSLRKRGLNDVVKFMTAEEMLASSPHIKFSGEISALTSYYVFQKIGANKYIVHERTNLLAQTLEVGKTQTIQYTQGKAQIVEKMPQKQPIKELRR